MYSKPSQWWKTWIIALSCKSHRFDIYLFCFNIRINIFLNRCYNFKCQQDRAIRCWNDLLHTVVTGEWRVWMMFMPMTPRCQEKIALCSLRLLERPGEVGSCSLPKLLCATRSSPKWWHLASFLYLPGSLPHVQRGRLVGYSLTPWFWPSDESADSFLPTHSASSGFLVVLGNLQVSLRVTVVHGAEKKQKVAHTGFSLLTPHVFWYSRGLESAYLAAGFLASSQMQSKEKMKFARTQLPCEALPLCILAHVFLR